MKLQPDINYGQILIAISFIGSVVGAYFLVRQDVAVLQEQVKFMNVKDVADSQAARDFRNDVLQELRALNVKMQDVSERLARQEARNSK